MVDAQFFYNEKKSFAKALELYPYSHPTVYSCNQAVLIALFIVIDFLFDLATRIPNLQ